MPYQEEEDLHLKQIVILGFNKSGSVSLQRYLEKKYAQEIPRLEYLHDPTGVKKFEAKYKDCKPVIITRDPLERLISMWAYYGQNKFYQFNEWLQRPPMTQTGQGWQNPLDSIRQEYHIKPFLKYKPKLYKFEKMIKLPDFPHENKLHREGLRQPESVKVISRKIIQEYLNGF